MTDDLRFEADLRAMLGTRDPGPVPAGLSAVIHERLRVDVRSRPAWWVARLTNLGSVAAMAVLALILVIAVGRAPATDPAAPLPPTSGTHVLKAGDGVVTGEHAPVFQALTFVVLIGGLVVVAVGTRRKWVGIGATLAALAVTLAGLNIGTSDALAFSGGTYGVTPFREAPVGEPGMYVAASGDQPFTLFLTVTNTSKLPLELRGLAMPAEVRAGTEDPLPILPRIVGLGLLPDEDITLEDIVPFRPVTIEPGRWVNVAVLGMAGSCSIPTGPLQAGTSIETINLVYDQLTITHDEAFMLPEPIVITWPERGCS